MLVLGRKSGEWIQVGTAKVFVLRSKHGRISLGIEAPRETRIVRGELLEKKDEPERDAA